MIEEDQLTPFEATLVSMKPRGVNLDRDRLMFLAGQASVVYWPRYRQSAFRPALFSAIVAAAVTLLAVTATESGSRIVDCVAAAATSNETAATRPAQPTKDAVQYRVDVGNSLGWVFSLLVGHRAPEADSPRSSQSLVQLREELLKQGVGTGCPEPRHGQGVNRTKSEAN